MKNFISKYLRKFKYLIRNYDKTFYIFNCLNQNSIFIDIGGNLGRISQYVIDVYSPKIVEIYEPHNALYLNLKYKFKNYTNVNIYDKAISDKDSKNYLYLKTRENNNLNLLEGSSLEKKKKNINKNLFQETRTINIKKILDKYDFIDCIKIDIEGHEYKILDTLIDNKNKIGKLICEFHGSDVDIKKNKNLEFRQSYQKYRDAIKELEKENWLVSWD